MLRSILNHTCMVWIDYFRNRTTPETEWFDRCVSWQRLGLTDLILWELLKGIRTPRGESESTRAALQLLYICRCGCSALRNSPLLRSDPSKGTIDRLIASFCSCTITTCCRTTGTTIHSSRHQQPLWAIDGSELEREDAEGQWPPSNQRRRVQKIDVKALDLQEAYTRSGNSCRPGPYGPSRTVFLAQDTRANVSCCSTIS